MSQEGKVSVIVKSRRVPVRTVTLWRPIYSTSGLLVGSQVQRRVVYGSAFDESHAQAIKEGKKLSCNLDLGFEVVDRSKLGPLRRLALRFLGSPEVKPSVILAPGTALASN